MKGTFSQSMAWLHTWSGLIAGWLLFMIFVTGTLTVYEQEITHWMQPELRGAHASAHEALATAEHYLQRHAAGAEEWEIALPHSREPVLGVHWHAGDAEIERHLDPRTGAELFARETAGGAFYNEMHYELRAGEFGLWFVGLLGVVLFAAIVTGIVIHRRIFKDFFTFRPSKGQRSWLDAHNLAGVMTIPFLLMISYTGVTISMTTFVPAATHLRYDGRNTMRSEVVQRFRREPTGTSATLQPLATIYDRGVELMGRVGSLAIHHPGDRNALIEVYRPINDRLGAVSDHAAYDGVTGELFKAQTGWLPTAYAYRAMVGLHVAQFGNELTRVLYFLAGSIGCILIATGQVLFIAKRRNRPGEVSASFLRFAEHLNVAMIAGALIACAGFLWANRLIPAALLGRAQWEAVAFFALWAATLLHAFVISPQRAWVIQLATAGSLTVLLPALNALTTDTGLIDAWRSGDRISLWFDLTALIIGVLLLVTARRVCGAKSALRGEPDDDALEAAT